MAELAQNMPFDAPQQSALLGGLHHIDPKPLFIVSAAIPAQ
jgi:hypothetical protein